MSPVAHGSACHAIRFPTRTILTGDRYPTSHKVTEASRRRMTVFCAIAAKGLRFIP